MCTTENSEFILCFLPGRGEFVSSGASWPGRHSWVIGWGEDGKGEEHEAWIRVGMGMLASLRSQLQQASEGEWIMPLVNLWMDQCLMGWWQPRAAGELAFVEGGRLINWPNCAVREKSTPSLFSLCTWVLLSTLPVMSAPMSPASQAKNSNQQLWNILESNLFLITERQILLKTDL